MLTLNLPPTHGPARDAALLRRIVAGQFDALQWGQISATSGAHKATFLVFADALKMDGVRVNVGGVNIQQIADLLNCMMLTARLADMMYVQRATIVGGKDPLTLLPSPQPETMDSVGWEQQSAKIDSLLAAGGGLAAGGIASTVGKTWILDNDLLGHPGKACNYGWWFPGSSFGGSSWESSVTPGLRLIQGRGFVHSIQENLDDYSQKCTLVSRECLVDGVQRDLVDVLTDPELAPLASHQGVLRVLRQPGVAPYSATPVVAPPA